MGLLFSTLSPYEKIGPEASPKSLLDLLLRDLWSTGGHFSKTLEQLFFVSCSLYDFGEILEPPVTHLAKTAVKPETLWDLGKKQDSVPNSTFTLCFSTFSKKCSCTATAEVTLVTYPQVPSQVPVGIGVGNFNFR